MLPVKGKVLPASFYERATLDVAPALLGKVLVAKTRGGATAVRLVETETYYGNDPASHCSRGPTPRCQVMFEHPGRAYVYFIYGMYTMLNFVCEPAGIPGAALIRAGEPLYGEALMKKRRGTGERSRLTNGPGRLCQAMGIEVRHSGEKLSGPALYVLDDGYRPRKVLRSPRVGIQFGKAELWRFFIADDPFVSSCPQNKEAGSFRR